MAELDSNFVPIKPVMLQYKT